MKLYERRNFGGFVVMKLTDNMYRVEGVDKVRYATSYNAAILLGWQLSGKKWEEA